MSRKLPPGIRPGITVGNGRIEHDDFVAWGDITLKSMAGR